MQILKPRPTKKILFLFKSKIRKVCLIKPHRAKPLEARSEATLSVSHLFFINEAYLWFEMAVCRFCDCFLFNVLKFNKCSKFSCPYSYPWLFCVPLLMDVDILIFVKLVSITLKLTVALIKYDGIFRKNIQKNQFL